MFSFRESEMSFINCGNPNPVQTAMNFALSERCVCVPGTAFCTSPEARGQRWDTRSEAYGHAYARACEQWVLFQEVCR